MVSGQARQMREMLRDADAALAVGSGGARRESVVSVREFTQLRVNAMGQRLKSR